MFHHNTRRERVLHRSWSRGGLEHSSASSEAGVKGPGRGRSMKVVAFGSVPLSTTHVPHGSLKCLDGTMAKTTEDFG
jgi:hypothetical protein